MSAGGQGVECLGLDVSQRAHGGTNGLSEVGQDRRVESIGLGQPSSGPGKVPYLTGVGQPQADAAAKAATNGLQAARGLQQHWVWAHTLYLGDWFPDPYLVVGDLPSLARRSDGNIHLGLGHIDATYVGSCPISTSCVQHWPVLG